MILENINFENCILSNIIIYERYLTSYDTLLWQKQLVEFMNNTIYFIR